MNWNWEVKVKLAGADVWLRPTEFTENQRNAIDYIIGNAGVDPAPPVPPEPLLTEAEREKSQKDAKRSQAVVSGYTGDPCNQCHGFRTKRNGSCLVCEDCGTTTGCS